MMVHFYVHVLCNIYTFCVDPYILSCSKFKSLNQLMSWTGLGLTTECVGCWVIMGVKLILIWSRTRAELNGLAGHGVELADSWHVRTV